MMMFVIIGVWALVGSLGTCIELVDGMLFMQ